MPITYRIDRENRLIWTTATGVLTDDELLEHKRKLTQDPAFEPGMRELSDVRAVERLEVTPVGVRAFVMQDAADSSLLRDHKLAIVASSDLVFGTARMYETLTEKNVPGVRVFRDMDAARAWLGVGSSS